jgi:hypothetical protein
MPVLADDDVVVHDDPEHEAALTVKNPSVN